MTKYFLYARKSTDDEDRQVLSIESQLNELRAFAVKENLEVIQEYIESMTAKCPGRPIFENMLKAIEDGKAEGILAWHPDRLARNSVDGGKIIYLADTGKVVDLRFPIYRFDNTAQGKFMLNIAFGQSKYYVDNLAENVKRGLREKLRRGDWPGWAPLGYNNDPQSRMITIDTERAPFIQRIFTTYADGNFSLEELLREVHRWNFLGRKGKPLRKSELALILRNPFYYGLMRYKGEIHEGRHPPIVAKKTFDRVQEVLLQKAKVVKKGDVKFAFAGLIKCGECGASITAEKQKGHTYYRCTKKLVPCGQKFIREEALLEQINQEILKVYIDDAGKTTILNRLEELFQNDSKASLSFTVKLTEEIKQLDDKVERVIDLFIDKQLTQEEYQKRKAKLLNDKKAIQEKLTNLQKTSGGWLEPAKQFVTLCNSAGFIARQGNPEQKRDFIKKNGSNHNLKEKTLSFHWDEPLNHALRHAPEKKWLRSRYPRELPWWFGLAVYTLASAKISDRRLCRIS